MCLGRADDGFAAMEEDSEVDESDDEEGRRAVGGTGLSDRVEMVV